MTSWKGSNTTPAVVSKCPGDRTTPKKLQANWRVGDPRKLYFSLDVKLFSEGSNTTPAVVSKCPGDRTRPNDAEVNWRVGDPRKLYFSLYFKLLSYLEFQVFEWTSSWGVILSDPQVNWRKGGPRKLYFSLDF